MAKMTRTEAIRMVKNLVRKNARVQAITPADLEAAPADYHERRAWARAILIEERIMDVIETQDKYLLAVTGEAIDEMFKVWHEKSSQLRREREQWQKALSGMSTREAQVKVLEMLKAMNIRGMQLPEDVSGGYFGSFEAQRTWGVSARLYVKIDSLDFDRRTENPDAPGQHVNHHKVTCEVSWSSSGRSLQEAACCLKLYQEVLDAANEIEVTMSRESIISKWGVPEPEPVVDASTMKVLTGSATV